MHNMKHHLVQDIQNKLSNTKESYFGHLVKFRQDPFLGFWRQINTGSYLSTKLTIFRWGYFPINTWSTIAATTSSTTAGSPRARTQSSHAHPWAAQKFAAHTHKERDTSNRKLLPSTDFLSAHGGELRIFLFEKYTPVKRTSAAKRHYAPTDETRSRTQRGTVHQLTGSPRAPRVPSQRCLPLVVWGTSPITFCARSSTQST